MKPMYSIQILTATLTIVCFIIKASGQQVKGIFSIGFISIILFTLITLVNLLAELKYNGKNKTMQ